MYRDALNEVGKNLKKTRRETNHAINRVTENFPKIERVRDFILAGSDDDDDNLPYDFVMMFKTKRDDNIVLLDLLFLPKLCSCSEGGDGGPFV